jgi:hypothetical protein
MRSRTSSRSSRARRGAIAAASACGLLALAATPAAAVDRFVIPAGMDTVCTESKPCDLETGLKDAGPGDVVRISGDLGIYSETKGIAVKAGVQAVGVGAQVPRVVFGSTGSMTVSPGSAVSNLDISRTSGTGVLLFILENSTASRLRLESKTGLPLEIRGTLTDSIVRYGGNKDVPAVQASRSTTLFNVNAISPPGAAINVYSGSLPCSAADVVIRNTILRGTYDVRTSGAEPNCGPTINIGNSNYRPGTVKLESGAIVDGGGNQTGVEPLLAADGIHQLAGSPTIDAGTAAISSLDIDGKQRSMGLAPDIGAEESPAVVDAVAPVGSELSFKPKTLRRKRGKPRGSNVSYRLSEAASTVFTVERRVKRGRCKRCTRFVAVRNGTLTLQGNAGVNGFRFTGIFSGRLLKPGAYRMTGLPTDAAGNAGSPFRATFRVARKR